MAEECSIHKLGADRVCGLVQCCRVVCPACFISHEMETGHHLAVRMCAQALTFFTHFAGYVQYKLLGWADAVRRDGPSAFFRVEAVGQQQLEQMRGCCAEVLHSYAQLMRGNREFVMANQGTPLITHPEFLKDLFNLVVQSWATSAAVIVDNLRRKLEDSFPGRYGGVRVEVQPHLMAVFEQERIQLLNRAGDILVRGCGNPENAVEVCPKGVAEHASAEESKEDEQLQPYFPPWSIRKIESIEEITERHQSSCSIRYDLPTHTHTADSIRETEDEHHCTDERTTELQEENQELKDENALLKMERGQLEAINGTLTQEGPRSANNIILLPTEQLPTPRQAHLLERIKQLQSELADRQSDISLLADCLADLSTRYPTLRSQLSLRLSSLRWTWLRV